MESEIHSVAFNMSWIGYMEGDTRFESACVVYLKAGSGRVSLDFESRVKFTNHAIRQMQRTDQVHQ